MIWTLLLTNNLLAADGFEPDYTDWLTPRVLEREALFDFDEITRRTLPSYRGSIPATIGDDTCTPSRSRTSTPFHLSPSKGEEGDWVGAKLTPGTWPFQVSEISYYLGEESLSSKELVADLSHSVALYVSSEDTPPDLDTATPIAELTLQLSDTSPGYNLAEAALDEPFTLYSGEHLYVAIELPGEWPEVMAILTCEQVTAPGGWWWSIDTDSWSHLYSYGIIGTPLVQASGYILF